MNNFRRNLVMSVCALPLALGMATTGMAQDPQPLRVFVPYSAGGSGDAVARLLVDGLREHLGRMVVVENKPGASGRIAILAMKSAPAENSVMLAFSGVLINSIIFQNSKDLQFKEDIVGLAQVGTMPAGLAVPMSHKANNVTEFIKMRKQEGDFTYGNIGQGSMTHLAGLRFAQATQMKANPIGYQGGAPMANDLMGGQIDSGIDTVGDFVERHKAKKLKVLGVFGSKRFGLLPDVPTMAEQGISNVEADIWLGFLAQSKVSPAFKAKFQEAVRLTLESPATKEKVARLLEIEYKPGEKFAKVMAADFETWTPVITAAGLINK